MSQYADHTLPELQHDLSALEFALYNHEVTLNSFRKQSTEIRAEIDRRREGKKPKRQYIRKNLTK